MIAGLANLDNTALRMTLSHASVQKVTTVQQLPLSLPLVDVANTSHFWASISLLTVWTVRLATSVMRMEFLTTVSGSAQQVITVMKLAK